MLTWQKPSFSRSYYTILQTAGNYRCRCPFTFIQCWQWQKTTCVTVLPMFYVDNGVVSALKSDVANVRKLFLRMSCHCNLMLSTAEWKVYCCPAMLCAIHNAENLFVAVIRSRQPHNGMYVAVSPLFYNADNGRKRFFSLLLFCRPATIIRYWRMQKISLSLSRYYMTYTAVVCDVFRYLYCNKTLATTECIVCGYLVTDIW